MVWFLVPVVLEEKCNVFLLASCCTCASRGVVWFLIRRVHLVHAEGRCLLVIVHAKRGDTVEGWCATLFPTVFVSYSVCFLQCLFPTVFVSYSV